MPKREASLRTASAPKELKEHGGPGHQIRSPSFNCKTTPHVPLQRRSSSNNGLRLLSIYFASGPILSTSWTLTPSTPPRWSGEAAVVPTLQMKKSGPKAATCPSSHTSKWGNKSQTGTWAQRLQTLYHRTVAGRHQDPALPPCLTPPQPAGGPGTEGPQPWDCHQTRRSILWVP